MYLDRVNKLTFGEEVPEYASTEELKMKLTLVIDSLLWRLNQYRSISEVRELKLAVRKYMRLYSQLLWRGKSYELGDRNYRKNIIEKYNTLYKNKYEWTERYKEYKEYQEKMIQIKTKEDLSELLSEVDTMVAEKTEEHFSESFFESWINKIRLWMQTITQGELRGIREKKKMMEEQGEKWKISIKIEEKYLDKQEKLLRDKIWIDKFKEELKRLEKLWNPKLLEAKQLEVTNKISKVLYEYPYQNTNNWYWYKPSKILKSEEMQCLWFSLVWHAFLSELWIRHNWIRVSWHAALSILIWSKKYLFDVTGYDKVRSFEVVNNHVKFTEIESIGDLIYWLEKFKIEWFWPPEKILFNKLVQNKMVDNSDNLLDEYKEKYTEEDNKKLRKILELCNRRLHINNDIETFQLRLKILEKLWEKKEIIRICKEFIENNPYKKNEIIRISGYLYRTWKNKDIFDILNTWIKLNPKSENLYAFKSDIFDRTWNKKLADLNEYVSLLLESRENIFNNLYIWVLYNAEKSNIKEYLKRQDYEWLRKYMKFLEIDVKFD